jgi:hypothetical protein
LAAKKRKAIHFDHGFVATATMLLRMLSRRDGGHENSDSPPASLEAQRTRRRAECIFNHRWTPINTDDSSSARRTPGSNSFLTTDEHRLTRMEESKIRNQKSKIRTAAKKRKGRKKEQKLFQTSNSFLTADVR